MQKSWFEALVSGFRRSFRRGHSRGRGSKSGEIYVCSPGRGHGRVTVAVAVALLTQLRDPGYGS